MPRLRHDFLIRAAVSEPQPIRIGVPQSDYNTDRNVIRSLPTWAVRVRPVDLYRLGNALKQRIGLEVSQSQKFTFCEPYLPRVKLLHFFNRVSLGRTPWICTFETSLPRWGDLPDAMLMTGLEALLAPACRRLIAISDAAAAIAAQEWRRLLCSADADVLCRKTEVLLPPQEVLLPETAPRRGGTTHFAFVGGDFYRKGGLQFLEALLRLYRRGFDDWRATVIGRLDSYGDYASRTTEQHRQRAREILSILGPMVSHAERASYPVVLKTLSEAHYYVFPTIADTFGYSVLEAQASGSVVISTNIRALPELVTSDRGIVIELPLDDRREVHRRSDWSRLESDLTDGVEAALLTALTSSEARRQTLVANAMRNLRERHCPRRHAESLEKIYLSALAYPRETTTGIR